MEVRPEIIQDNLENTGIRENNGRVYCLRFRDGGNIQGRVVMAQGEKVVDDRRYDDYMNDYMNEHKGQKRIKTIEDEHDKLIYTDLDGNTTICEITKEPRDLNCSDKELLQVEMEKLDNASAYILNSDMPLQAKTQEFMKINNKRLELFKSYGIEVPTVENEIEADIEISEEVQDYAEERIADEEEASIKEERDPRESSGSHDEGRLPSYLMDN